MSQPAGGGATVHCHGWWEQRGMGRQPMNNLLLDFAGTRFHGAGIDIVGQFTLAGEIENDGRLTIEKQYLGKHAVLYFGAYDGEGTMSGKWSLGFDHGDWLIRIAGLTDAAAEITTKEEFAKE